MDRSEVAIIIPAYNEEKTIEMIVDKAKRYGIVIVVDDASKDHTAELAGKAGAIVVSHPENKGYDGALNSGFKKATELDCKYAITFDADGQHDAEMIPIFIDKMENNRKDLIIGVRPQKARMAEFVFAIYTKIRYRISDPLCGMKGYSMQRFREIGYFDSYRSIGTELCIHFVRKGYPYCQFSVPLSHRRDQSRFGKKISANLRIIRALLYDIFK